MVAFVEITDRAAVGYDIAVKTVCIPQNLTEQTMVRAARFAVHAVVRAHNSRRMCRRDDIGKRRQVCSEQIRVGYVDIENVTQLFRSAVYGVMLQGRVRLAIFSVALQTADKGVPHMRGQIRILTIGFVTSAPTRIAENIDIGRPHGQSLIGAGIAERPVRVVFGTRFFRDHTGNLV